MTTRAEAMFYGFAFIFEKHPIFLLHAFARPAIQFAVDFQPRVSRPSDFLPSNQSKGRAVDLGMFYHCSIDS